MIPKAPYEKDCAKPTQPRTTEMLGPPNKMWAWKKEIIYPEKISWADHLSCDCWKLCKSKKVHQPHSNYECREVKLSYIEDTDQVNGEKDAN